jgi:hypothetical protein
MKDNIKKLAVFVMIIALAIFMAVATASADGQKYRKTLHGEYAFTGSGVCTLSPTGFDPDFIPNTPGSAWMGPNFWEGVYTFNHNGKGKMETQQCYNEGPAAMVPMVPMVPYSSGCADLSWEFEYEIDGGAITFTFTSGTYSLVYTAGPNVVFPPIPIPPNTSSLTEFDQPWTGRISPDGKNLFVFYGGPFLIKIKDFGPFEAICNTVHQGFRTK